MTDTQNIPRSRLTPDAETSEQSSDSERLRVLIFFAALVVLTLLLRLPYASYLFHDDGLWFTAGEELLRGKALYREIYFDKPPVSPLVYAGLFKLFGAHLLTIRLFMIFESVIISAVLYRFGQRFYDQRVGMLAAALFTFFSTTSVNNHVQGLNTDFLMLLPYAAAAYLLTRACVEQSARLALTGGALVGLAFMTNPKGIFILLFFALLLIVESRWLASNARIKHSVLLFTLAIVAFAFSLLPFLIYLTLSKSLGDYWVYSIRWGASYTGYLPIGTAIANGVWLTAKYFVRNNTLLFALAFVVAVTARRVRAVFRKAQADGVDKSGAAALTVDRPFRADAAMLLWLAVSYAGLSIGGRFYSNYFFQILPSLCLIGARGLFAMRSSLKRARPAVRRAVFAMLVVGFVATAAVFHIRTAALAADWLRGAKSKMARTFYHEELNREERMVAAVVRGMPDPAAAADSLGREELRADSPRTRAASGPADYLFVWGARAEIYYWSGLLPASRYLMTQPLTGVPADFHHEHGKDRALLSEALTAQAREQLVRDLEQTPPQYIVDELGFFNSELAIVNYPETREFLKDYKNIGATGRFLIYRRKDRAKEDQSPTANQ